MPNIYMIGNSLTDQVRYSGFQALAESRGKSHIWGRSMVPGAPLEFFVNNPTTGFNQEPFGYYQNAFCNYQWDVVTLQSYDRHLYNEELIGDIQALDTLLAPLQAVSPNVQIYIYAQWPLHNGLDWDTQWLRPYTGSWDGTYRTQAYYELLTHELHTAEPSLKIPLMIPVGQVIYALNKRMKAGLVPGYNSITQLYTDETHLNNVGSYLVALTFFATIYQENPLKLPIPQEYQPDPTRSYDQALSSELAAILQNTVWDVVTTTLLAGVSAVGPLSIRTVDFPEAVQSQQYLQSLDPVGRAGFYTWQITDGPLPTGLTPSNTRVLSGIPTATGIFNFTVQVSDANGATFSKPFSLVITPDTIPEITTTALPVSARGSLYQHALMASNRNGAVTWKLISGTLPAGITLRSDGLLSGPPGIEGTSTFTVQATDSDTTPDSDTETLTLPVGAPTADTLLIAKTLSPITIDGNLNDGVWSLTERATRSPIGTSNNLTSFAALWDSSYLYLAVQVTDSDLYKDSANIWDDDAIEVFIDARHDRQSVFNNDDRQLIVDINGNLFEQGGRTTGILRSVQITATGYTVEMAIPWSNLGLIPTENLTIGFDIANDDDDNGGTRDSQLTWNDVNVLNLSPRQFGNLILTGREVRAEPVNSGESGSGTSSNQVIVNFENLSPGNYGNSAYNDPSGYTFADVAPLADNLQVYSTGNGFQSNVLHSANWGHTIRVKKTDGSNFDLASFDYAASIYGDTVDAIVTGYLANGTTQTANFITSSKQLQTLSLNWTNLTQVDIDFAAGTNAAFGALDNFVFGGAPTTGNTGPSLALITFDNLNTGSYGNSIYQDASGYTFADMSLADPLQIYGTGNGFQSNVLHPNNWGHGIRVTKTGGSSFDVLSFDYASSVYGDMVDATVTGYFTDGTTQVTNFVTSSKQLQTLSLNWIGVTHIDIDFAAGSNPAFGALDNFLLRSSASTTNTTSSGGSAATNNRLTVTFEDLHTGNYGSNIYQDSHGYTFTNSIPTADNFVVYGTNNGYQSKVLHANNWNQTIQITKTDGSNFDLVSFDYAASIYGDTADATVTGYLANGSTRVANFITSSKQLETLSLDWVGLARVDINFGAGNNTAYGALDNFVFGVR
ncbi:MAG: sugar-binding protein [Leptodesmis sp.]|uniref:sugar-binding protein n=1 Tax=Leptodesmis sp. TaxID=3100501 RepID=UPI003D123043